MYEEQNIPALTGKNILDLIQTCYTDEKNKKSRLWFTPQYIQDVKNLLKQYSTVDFMTNEEKAFELIQIFLSGLKISIPDQSHAKNVLLCAHEFYYPACHDQDNAELILLNKLCEKLFNTSREIRNYNDFEERYPQNHPEIEALLHCQQSEFFSIEIFSDLRRMSNAKEGIIALKILDEAGIIITPVLKKLLCLTIQPAYLARTLYYLNSLQELNETNIERLTNCIRLWESTSRENNIKSIECDDDEGRAEAEYYLHKIRLFAMLLEYFSIKGNLTIDKVFYFLAPEREYLLENSDIFSLLNRDSLSPILPVIMESLLLQENRAFLESESFGKNLNELKSIIMRFPRNINITTQHVTDLMCIIITKKNNNFDPDPVGSYLLGIGAKKYSVVENDQHIENINQIKNYLKNIGFLTADNKDEIQEIFEDPDYSALYTFTFESESLAHQIILIPGDLFIEHNMWDKLLACCTTNGSLHEAFYACISEIHRVAIHRNSPTPPEEQLNSFEQLVTILEKARDEENAYKDKPNSLANSIAYQRPDFSIIVDFVNSIKQEKIQEAIDWLRENPDELQKGRFGKTFKKELEKEQPFGCSNLTELQSYLEQQVATLSNTKGPEY